MSVQSKSNKFLYFAYGSNLLSHRIHINNSSAERAGIGCLHVCKALDGNGKVLIDFLGLPSEFCYLF